MFGQFIECILYRQDVSSKRGGDALQGIEDRNARPVEAVKPILKTLCERFAGLAAYSG